MGMIGSLFATLFGGNRNVIRETVEVFRPNAEAEEQRLSIKEQAALAQFAAEFAAPRKGLFDRFVDGLNRLPRPALALGTLGLFVAAMIDPIWFAGRMQGIALVPEDRRKQGLVLTQTTRPNISLVSLGNISRHGFINHGLERRRARRMIDHFGIVPSAIDGEVAFYSGGNQQKVLLSKWAVENPRLLILDEPSRGVDIGARQSIHEFIIEMAENGVAVLLISSELEEVINLSHRGYLMSDGRIFAETDCRNTTVDEALHRIFEEQGAVSRGKEVTQS